MKRMMQWMIAAILVCGVGVFTSCTSNYDNPTPGSDGQNQWGPRNWSSRWAT